MGDTSVTRYLIPAVLACLIVILLYPLVTNNYTITKNGAVVDKFPVILKPGELLSLQANSQHAVKVIIDVVTSAPLSSRYNGSEYRYQCLQSNTMCSHQLTITERLGGMQFIADNQTIIQKMGMRTVRHISQGFLNEINKNWLFLSLILLVALVWCTHSSVAVSQWVLNISSIGFLLWIDVLFTVFLISYISIIYAFGNNITARKKSLSTLYLSLLSCIFFLFLFKYFYNAIQSLFFDVGSFALLAPLGISYFVIRLIDTQLKWYRNEIPSIGYRQFLCFITFPATLPAGPIDTVDNFNANRLNRISLNDITHGISRIIIGVFKKAVLADFILFQILFEPGGYYDRVAFFPIEADQSDIVIFLSLALCFVYLDFSAYSDIAIGFSRLLGYRIVENFNWPLLARNIRVFWSRWHMSLSNWCMRNIYMPVMIMTKNFYTPAYVVMLVVGLWHSLTLPWLCWALHHASGLSLVRYLEDRFPAKKTRTLPNWIKQVWGIASIAITFLFAASAHAFTQFADSSTAVILYYRFWFSLITLIF